MMAMRLIERRGWDWDPADEAAFCVACGVGGYVGDDLGEFAEE